MMQIAKTDFKYLPDNQEFTKELSNMVRSIMQQILIQEFKIENRFQTIEEAQQLIVDSGHRLESNLLIYREDSKDFMKIIHQDNETFQKKIWEYNETFRKEIRENNETFRKEIREDNKAFRLEIRDQLEKFRLENEKFRQEIKIEFEKFKQEIRD